MENELDNGAVNPENKCFCRQGYCLKSGLIDVTDCYYGKIFTRLLIDTMQVVTKKKSKFRR